MFKGDLREISKDEVLFQWVWAVYEQHYLLGLHDAYWINEAANGWTDSGFYEFLRNYRLLRGKRGALFSKEKEYSEDARAYFIELCNTIFRPSIHSNPYIDEVQERWTTVQQKLKEKLFNHSADRDELGRMPSATLKAFWFHHPDKLPMYDQLALKGLKKHKKGTNQSNFLHNFYEFYDENEEKIKKAQAFFSREYPYPRRIAEKFLWLEGKPEAKEVRLKRFKAAIDVWRAAP